MIWIEINGKRYNVNLEKKIITEYSFAKGSEESGDYEEDIVLGKVVYEFPDIRKMALVRAARRVIDEFNKSPIRAPSFDAIAELNIGIKNCEQ